MMLCWLKLQAKSVWTVSRQNPFLTTKGSQMLCVRNNSFGDNKGLAVFLPSSLIDDIWSRVRKASITSKAYLPSSPFNSFLSQPSCLQQALLILILERLQWCHWQHLHIAYCILHIASLRRAVCQQLKLQYECGYPQIDRAILNALPMLHSS